VVAGLRLASADQIGTGSDGSSIKQTKVAVSVAHVVSERKELPSKSSDLASSLYVSH
jgi:hypothetical protein